MASRDDIVAYLDRYLEVPAFADYCPNGLQVEGRPRIDRLVSGVTACQALIERAIGLGADALLVHHGYFWKGEDPRVVGMKRRRLGALLAQDVNLLAYHLPLDAHPEVGNNARMARLLGARIEGGFGEAGGRPVALHGRLDPPLGGGELARRLAEALGREPLHVPGARARVERLGWCTGAAQGLIEEAAALGLDGYVTGEVSEQTVHAARENGLHFYAAGHHATERYGVQALGEHLARRFGLEHHFVDIDNPA